VLLSEKVISDDKYAEQETASTVQADSESSLMEGIGQLNKGGDKMS